MHKLLSYSLLEKFHDGSNNQLYRAQRSDDQTPVVIKIPRSEYPSPRELARLYNEYQLLSELDIPGVPRVYSLEKFSRSAALVMENLVGQSLSAVLRARQLTVRECLAIAVELTKTLEALHSRKIVHRDIKPSNIRAEAEVPG